MSFNDSPFVVRLNTNYAPSDSEILEIHALLVDSENELARIDARIEEMEIALAQLKEQRASLKGPIDAHRALLAPIRRIPQDVLVEIFLSCLPSEHNALIDPAEAPLVLGRSDTGEADTGEASRTRRRCYGEKIVKEWLERSATCSLSVSFVDTANYVPDFDSHPLLLQLLPFSRRLRHVTLTGDATFLQSFLRLGSENLPLLQTLRTNLRYSIADSLSAFRIPTLRDIALGMDTEPHSLPLPWSQLTSLRLACGRIHTDHSRMGGLHIGGAFDILRRCPNLVHCALKLTEVLPDAELDTSSIVLPYLKTLVFPMGPFNSF
ncbi:hypothetical protein MSAN_00332400 [Mycena sanguinolenta]|uniref:F-box domain-containing protein n=1 Tax=Mycena sanguinolenta TaxID=230812 RepID=A0A8H6ZDV5_9AGAR|nr:hypothetical protein MSAN_00332400 [Mycena sanguinolenta]